MLVRRLLLLMLFLVVLMVGLGARLAELQIKQSQRWKDEAQLYIRRHMIVETTRGPIVDVKGRVLAEDEGCYDLAIDYRAMNLDDRWITQVARARMTSDGITRKADRQKNLPDYKRKVADQIQAIPAAISKICGLSDEDVQQRYNAIRARMMALRQAVGHPYDPKKDGDNTGADATDDSESAADIKEQRMAHTLVPNVPDSIAFIFDKRLDEFPGLVKVASRRRVYPYGNVAAHLIGALKPVDETTLKLHRFLRSDNFDDSPGDLKGYLPGDRMGAFGIEKLAEEKLRGTRGTRLVDLDSNDIQGQAQDPIAGSAVQLSLDVEFQRNLQAALADESRHLCRGQDGENHPVALVVLNAVDSSVIAMLSLPTYDLNDYDQHITEWMKDTVNLPLQNRVIAAAYPPGSTVKPLLAAAAITEGIITPEDIVTCNGYLFPNRPTAYRCDIYLEHPGATHGPLDLAGALEKSCNIYFYTLGMKMGYDRQSHWFSAFGLGEQTGIELASETRGVAPRGNSDMEEPQRKLEAIMLGIGQGRISVTPLQMANAYATLLRGGLRIAPSIIRGSSRPQNVDLGLAPSAVAAVKAGMFNVVNGTAGTARKIKLNIALAGKTGSATATRPVWVDGKRESRTDSDAWFVGYVPADEPKYVIAALMEFGGHGGVAAGPMARETVVQLERAGYLPNLDNVDTGPVTVGDSL